MVNMEEMKRLFKQPPRIFSPVPTWWWSGEKLELERLKWQMKQFSEGGIYNLMVLNLAPAGPTAGKDADDPLYMTEEWWSLLEEACLYARELGMYIWFYDQIGFSGAKLQGRLISQNPEFAGRSIHSEVKVGTGRLEVCCPPDGVPVAAFVTLLDENDNSIIDTMQIPVTDGRASSDYPGRHSLRLVYEITEGFDYCSPEACNALLNIVHGAIEKRLGYLFGSVIAGSYQDELPSMPNWCKNFIEQFKIRKKYDCTGKLNHLWEGDNPEARRFRLDYQQVRAELIEEAFFKPFCEWHERNGLLSGFDQGGDTRSGDAVSTMRSYADYFRTHRWYTAPGSDHDGDAKIHSSIAHLNERPRTWIESFHSSGWGGTLEETFDWLLPWYRAGANLYNPHAVYYSTKAGWFEWAPPSTCWRQPYWKHYRIFADAISRLSYLLTRGHHCCDIGVLYPTSTIQANVTLSGLLPQAQKSKDIYRELVGRMKWDESYVGILDEACRDYDVIDEITLDEAEVSNGQIRIRNERYKVIILPGCQIIQPHTAAILCRFAESGGLLIAINNIPNLPGEAEDDQRICRLHALFDEGIARYIPVRDDQWVNAGWFSLDFGASGTHRNVLIRDQVISLLDEIPKVIDTAVPTLHRYADGQHILFVPAAKHKATVFNGRDELGRKKFMLDHDLYAKELSIFIRGGSGPVYLWDVLTGELKEILCETEPDGVRVNVAFDKGPAVVLTWPDNASVSGGFAASSNEKEETGQWRILKDLNEPWETELIPTMDNRHGDFDRPCYEGAPPVATWHFEHCTEEDALNSKAKWITVQATFGTKAWWSGPYKTEDLPDPAELGIENTPATVEGWKPVVYSSSRGMQFDDIHGTALGVSGHVPEEFMYFNNISRGQAVHVRTGIWSEQAQDAYLAVGCNCSRRAWIDGTELKTDSSGYLSFAQVSLEEGLHVLDLQFIPEPEANIQTGPFLQTFSKSIRAYYCFVNDPESFARPEWIRDPGISVRGDKVTFSYTVDVPFNPEDAVLQITPSTPCNLTVNGQSAGLKGDFTANQTLPYTVRQFKKGINEIAVEMKNNGNTPILLVDGIIRGEGKHIKIMTDSKWFMQVNDNARQSPALSRNITGDMFGVRRDGCYYRYNQAPHPLPEAEWLEKTYTNIKRPDVIADPLFGQRKTEWYRWIIPPGATEMTIRTKTEARLWVDGEELGPVEGSIVLPNPNKACRQALLRVTSSKEYTEGAVFEGPVEYKTGPGTMLSGDWCGQGLGAYSGGVLYRKTIEVNLNPDDKVALDLGRVRGTAEVIVNGKSAGVAIWSPYVFRLDGLLVNGSNEIQIKVFNTLAPYLSAVSPTKYIYHGQTVSGIIGPVRLKILSE